MSTKDQLLSIPGVLTSAGNLPRSPWIYHVPYTPIVVTVVYLAVVVVSDGDVLASLLHAANDVITHISTGDSQLMNEQELVWDSETVRLNRNPAPQMTWVLWGATIQGLSHFMDIHNNMTIIFGARDQLLGGSVSGGSIINMNPSTTENNHTDAYWTRS